MRAWSFVPLLALFACQASLPRGIPVAMNVRANGTAYVRANVRVDARVHLDAPPPPPPPAPAVDLQGAPVVEFFGIPLEGAQDVVFVLDISGSMDDPARGQLAQLGATTTTDPNAQAPVDSNAPPPAGANAQAAPAPAVPQRRKLDVARSELVDALGRLPTGTRMNVVFFNSNVDAIAPGIVVLDDNNRPTIEAYVRETEADGATALAPAMRVAFLLDAKRVILLSDGLGNVNGTSEDVMRDAREAIRAGIRIDTIGIGPDQDRWLLSSLASESGGLYQAF